MEILRKEVLLEMQRNGRVYSKEEVKNLASEALAWREGKDPTAFDGVKILVPRLLIMEGYVPAGSFSARDLREGQTKLVRFQPLSGSYVYAAVTRMPEP